jgi:hypothetical protein
MRVYFKAKGDMSSRCQTVVAKVAAMTLTCGAQCPLSLPLLLRRSQPEVTTTKVLNRGPTSVSFHCEPFLLFDQHGDHSPRNAWVPGW